MSNKIFCLCLKNLLVENKTVVNAGTNIMLIKSEVHSWYIMPNHSGKITFLVFQGERLRLGDYIYRIEKM